MAGSASASTSTRLGIVAGWGQFPVELAVAARAQGRDVFVAAIKEHADPKLRELSAGYAEFGVAKLGAQMQFFRRHQVREVLLAGKLFKDRILFHGWGWIGHLPDWTCLKTLSKSFITARADQRDDTLLTAVVDAFQLQGLQVLASVDIAPQLMAEPGVLTRRAPNRRETLDIEFGWSIARQMGQLDIGQSIVVRDRTVLGVEAIEGTDALIARTAALCPRGGFTLVKVAKPQQDMRFDVPTIGLRTIEQLHRAGGTAIAIEAGKTIFVDREATIRRANHLGIAITSLQRAGEVATVASTHRFVA